jgi:hypothetical protein
LTNEIRKAGNENNLAETEGHIDDILKGELEKYAMGNTEAAETAALGQATHRLERLITQRRAALMSAYDPKRTLSTGSTGSSLLAPVEDHAVQRNTKSSFHQSVGPKWGDHPVENGITS